MEAWGFLRHGLTRGIHPTTFFFFVLGGTNQKSHPFLPVKHMRVFVSVSEHAQDKMNTAAAAGATSAGGGGGGGGGISLADVAKHNTKSRSAQIVAFSRYRSSALLHPFLGEGSPTKIDYRKRVPLF